MSRFFRSGSSSDSDSSIVASDDSNGEEEDGEVLTASQLITRPQDIQSEASSAQADTRIVSAADRASNIEGASHRDLLLHALLEERCMRQVRDDLGSTAGIDKIRDIAQRQYTTLTSRLAGYGFIEAGYDTAAFGTHRQAARDALDTLVAGHTSAPPSDPITTQLALDFNALQLFRPQLDIPQLPFIRSPSTGFNVLGLPGSSIAPGPAVPEFLSASRYHREFEEVCTLGRGGYGVVYQCKHRFDGRSYAVKKVPLGSSRLQRIRAEGQAEVDRLLLELTTLAKLDHPNVVRYFGGWIEMTTFSEQGLLLEGNDARLGASDQASSYVSHDHSTAWRVAELGCDDDFISFETSKSRDIHDTLEATSTSDSGETLQRQSTRDTQATVSDAADTESFTRSVSASADYSTLSSFAHSNVPCLALHIQMGLYPLSLADFLSRSEPIDASGRHCFHLEPSLRILSALIEGVSYLHSQGIVHRDLKPANIFLAQVSPQDHPWCHQCLTANKTIVNGIKVRIGDFGLVAALGSQDTPDAYMPVGTELYRPHDMMDRRRLEALDWFALGIIAFEMLTPFSTRMERHEALTNLRNGTYPKTFNSRLGPHERDVSEMIELLLRNEQAVSSLDLHNKIDALLKTC